MPRKYVPIDPNDPYHISARCINQEWFCLPLETVWSIMCDYLFLVNLIFKVRIHSFVLMSNHFHLIMTAPEGNLSEALLYFMRETSKEITRLSGRINQTYGSRNHKTRIGSYHHFLNCYKYVYRNPVRANLCERVEDYPYSTLHGLVGLSQLVVPVANDSLLFNPTCDESTLNWLNTNPKSGLEEEVRLALRRSDFALKTSRRTGKRSFLEDNLL